MTSKFTKEIHLETPTQPDPKGQPSLWEVSFAIQTREHRRAGTMDSGVARYDLKTGEITHSDFHDHDLHNQVRFAVHRAVAPKQKAKGK